MYWVLYSVLCTVRKSPLWVQHSDVSKFDFFLSKVVDFFFFGFIFDKSFNCDHFCQLETHSTVRNFWWSRPLFLH